MRVSVHLDVTPEQLCGVLDFLEQRYPTVKVHTAGTGVASEHGRPTRTINVDRPVQADNSDTAYQSTVAPLEPVASHTVGSDIHRTESVVESVETAPARIDIQGVREAVQAAVQRIDAKFTEGNSNATGRIINLLDGICGCKKVTDIPSDKYPAVIEGLATLGVE